LISSSIVLSDSQGFYLAQIAIEGCNLDGGSGNQVIGNTVRSNAGGLQRRDGSLYSER